MKLLTFTPASCRLVFEPFSTTQNGSGLRDGGHRLLRQADMETRVRSRQ
jgi:hypothetical protein